MPPVTPPHVKTPEPVKPLEASIKTETSTEPLNLAIVPTKPDIKNIPQQETPNSFKKTTKLQAKNETGKTDNNNLIEVKSTAQAIATKVVRKSVAPITPVASSSTTTPATKAINSNRTNVIISSPSLEAALENESNVQTTSDSDRSDNSDEGEDPILPVLVPKPITPSEPNSTGYKSNSYANVLGKFYSRESSSIAMALESAANELEMSVASKLSSKRSKQVQQHLEVPADLRIGNYPAKVNSSLNH